MEATKTEWTVEKLKARLARDPKAVERALVTLWYHQTESERVSQSTKEDNGVGFTGVDAFILSSFAEQVQRNPRGYPEGQRLSPKQRAIAEKRILKYAGQLLRIGGKA